MWKLNQVEEIQAVLENAVCEEELACQLNLPYCNIYMLIPILQNLWGHQKTTRWTLYEEWQMNLFGKIDDIWSPNMLEHEGCQRNCCLLMTLHHFKSSQGPPQCYLPIPFHQYARFPPLHSMKCTKFLLVINKWSYLVYTALRGPLCLLVVKSYVRNWVVNQTFWVLRPLHSPIPKVNPRWYNWHLSCFVFFKVG